MKNENLDELIKKYSRELVKMNGAHKEDSVTVTDVPESLSVALLSPSETNTTEDETPSYKAEEGNNNALEEAEESLSSVSDDTAPTAPEALIDNQKATSSATFFAEVATGENAYPVAGAKVVIYRGDNIYAFLESDETGRTKLIRLPAFSKENSLDAQSNEQSIEYLADIFSPGFVSQKGLVVSAVGGSDIILNVLLVPEEERMS